MQPEARPELLARDLLHALDVAAFSGACGLGELDDWQRRVLEAPEAKVLMNCSRQSGKSTTAALLAVHTAVYDPGALVLLLSPSQRQSAELFRKVLGLYHALVDKPEVALESALRLELRNGSRVVSLPGSERTTRGFSKARLVVLDEAARIDDQLIAAVRPMMATTRGARLAALSTPCGRRGWFFEKWHGDDPGWLKVRVTADECPRISAEFLQEERGELGDLVYRQEYLCEFVDSDSQVFPSELIEAAFDVGVQPLFT